MPEKPETSVKAGKALREYPEAYYQKKILDWLKKTYPDNGFFWKVQGGPYGHNGIPDICGMVDGHFFGFEVKKPGGKATVLQREAIRQITAAGGTALVVTTVDDVKLAVEAWKDGQRNRTE